MHGCRTAASPRRRRALSSSDGNATGTQASVAGKRQYNVGKLLLRLVQVIVLDKLDNRAPMLEDGVPANSSIEDHAVAHHATGATCLTERALRATALLASKIAAHT